MKKRLLITSIVMMLVVAVALSTATYAWFTSNNQVSATAVVLTASAADGDAILIARNATGSDASASIALASTANFLYPATPLSAAAFESAVSESTFQNLIMDGTGTYVDATSEMTTGEESGNDVSFYKDTFYVFNRGSQAKRLVPVVNINYDPTSTVSTMAAKSVRIAIVERTSKAEVGLTSAITGTADANLNAYSLKGIWQFDASSEATYTALAANATFSSNAYYYTRTGTGESEDSYVYTKATVTGENFDELKSTLYIVSKNVATRTGANSAYGATDADEDGAFDKGTINFTAGGDYAAFTLIPAATSGMQRAHEYTVVIWLEGWDADCTNQITSGSFRVDLSFTASV